ncbi:MAG: ATP-binding protein [Deltaproteobacteria bacterium]|nr:MAG: ATP-binding protein [Deltaproteobacteria bacterium]
MYQRFSKKRIVQLLKDFRIVYLIGPRQAGKSTLAMSIARETGLAYYTLDDTALLLAARTDPQGLLGALSTPMVLDEFQLAPELIRAVKQISDSAGPVKKGLFLLTGSADVFKSAKTQEALPGHMARIELFPLSQEEIHGNRCRLLDGLFEKKLPVHAAKALDRKTIANALIHGGYPEIQSKSPRSRSVWFASYISGRLLKDFESMHAAKGDYYSKLDALIRYLAGLSGNLVKYAAISRNLRQDDKTVKRYMEVLELMFILHRLEPYVRNTAKRGVVGMPKLHFLDTGLACHLLGQNKPGSLHTSRFYGALLETLVVTEFFKQAVWAEDDYRFWHFRDRAGNEVDVVVENSAGEVVGVEIKASATIKLEDFRGLVHLADYARGKMRRGVVFYSGANLLPVRVAGHTFHAVPLHYLGLSGH